MNFHKLRNAWWRFCGFVVAYVKVFVFDTKARVSDGIVEIMVGLILIGSMGASAWNFGATNFTLADAPVKVMVGTVVPLMVGVGCLMVFLQGRRSRGG